MDISLSFTVDRLGDSPKAIDHATTLSTLNCNCSQLVTGTVNKCSEQDREMSGLSPAFTMAIPKGRSSEEGVAGKEARPVEVVTASGEY